jgi:hypothetical protein
MEDGKMTKLEALRTLAAKVEAGEAPENTWRVFGSDEVLMGFSHKAYHGSLDAAKALHESVLPGWDYCIDSEDDGVAVFSDGLNGVVAHNENPARAWLLSILKAMISELENE